MSYRPSSQIMITSSECGRGPVHVDVEKKQPCTTVVRCSKLLLCKEMKRRPDRDNGEVQREPVYRLSENFRRFC